MTNKDLTHICLIVDRSGSMHRIAGDMDGAILEFLEKQAAEPGEVRVDVVTFDDVVETAYVDVAPGDVVAPIIKPRGSTALLDAVGKTIVRLGEKFAAMPEDQRPGHVIVVTVTDGLENASVEYAQPRVKDLVTHQMNEYGWTFLYFAANVDAFGTGASMGYRPDNVMAYAASASGSAGVGQSLAGSASRVRRGGSAAFTDEEREAAEGS
jgi:hypothetical protein